MSSGPPAQETAALTLTAKAPTVWGAWLPCSLRVNLTDPTEPWGWGLPVVNKGHTSGKRYWDGHLCAHLWGLCGPGGDDGSQATRRLR